MTMIVSLPRRVAAHPDPVPTEEQRSGVLPSCRAAGGFFSSGSPFRDCCHRRPSPPDGSMWLPRAELLPSPLKRHCETGYRTPAEERGGPRPLVLVEPSVDAVGGCWCAFALLLLPRPLSQYLPPVSLHRNLPNTGPVVDKRPHHGP